MTDTAGSLAMDVGTARVLVACASAYPSADSIPDHLQRELFDIVTDETLPIGLRRSAWHTLPPWARPERP